MPRSLWNFLSGDESVSNERDQDPRVDAELQLTDVLLNVVLDQSRDILLNRRRIRHQTQQNNPANADDLTKAERDVFHRSSYFGWTEGALAGGLTFAVLFGGIRWWATRGRGGGPSMLTSNRRNYSDLDPVRRRRRQFNPNLMSSQPHAAEEGLSDSTMVPLQFICTGAVALIVMNVVANATADLSRFYRGLAKLPLQPGASPLCHDVCPVLIDRLERLQQVDSKRQGWNGYAPNELLREPETLQLESMVQFVHHCRLRQTMEAHLRRRDHLADDAVVTIPNPGVPVDYVQVQFDTKKDDSEEQETSTQ